MKELIFFKKATVSLILLNEMFYLSVLAILFKYKYFFLADMGH